MRIAVLADTHIPKRAKALPETACAILRSCDAIIHAGDIVSQSFLETLEKIAPVYAVLGNNDLDLSLPERLELDLAGVDLGIIHDSGSRKGRCQRMRKLFPAASVVVFGHSHMPVNQLEDGLLLFNPGSATDRRRQPKHTMGLLDLSDGKIEASIVVLD